jgi:hypothetical protein
VKIKIFMHGGSFRYGGEFTDRVALLDKVVAYLDAVEALEKAEQQKAGVLTGGKPKRAKRTPTAAGNGGPEMSGQDATEVDPGPLETVPLPAGVADAPKRGRPRKSQ